MRQAEFDAYAEDYADMHRRNIAVTGEDPDFFAAYKVADAARWARRLANPVRDILDFGCGIGNSVPWFRQHFPRSALTCADVSAKSIACAQERFVGPERYVEIQEDCLPLEADGFDLAFTACVFHHIDAAAHVLWLAQLHRVVRRGGHLVLFEHNPLNPLTVHAVNTCPFDEGVTLIRAGTMKARLRQAGWRVRACRYRLFFPRALAFLRPLERGLGWLPLGAQYVVVAEKIG